MLSSDQSQLYAQRLKLAKPDQYVVLPEVISKEPLGPAVRQGDEAWFNIVRWTLYGLLNAEELGVTSSNVERQARDSRNPDVARLLGSEGDAGRTCNCRATGWCRWCARSATMARSSPATSATAAR